MPNDTPTYSIAVALFDYLPVSLTALALALLAQGIGRRLPALAPLAIAAAVLVPLGGFCKASWKLILALGGPDLAWLSNLLFIALAPGFILMAYCMFHAARAWAGDQGGALSRPRLAIWLALPLLAAAGIALALPDSRAWLFTLLGVTTVANATLIVHAVRASVRARLGMATVSCFIYNFAATLALSGLARLPPSNGAAWLQEGVNFTAQAALALGCWALSSAMIETRPQER